MFLARLFSILRVFQDVFSVEKSAKIIGLATFVK